MVLTKERLAKAIPEHESVRQLAKVFGVRVQSIYQRIKDWGLSLDELKDRVAEERGEPTPEEIAARAEEIRKSWSPAETQRRIVGGGPRRWRPPSYRFGELVGVAESISISRRRG